jgi:hypothetical protein
MIDGGGQFLKESRRGFPTPWVAFCRLSGLSGLFPGSRLFSMYYLGHLSPEKPHPAPVLSGACFWVSRAILREVGSFDERFFLYAEDIDLSYRIGQAGYTNYYTPAATIIHFKGESTRRYTRYIRQFYRAMRLFSRKHFNRGIPALFNWGLEAAIRVRAFAAAIAGIPKRKPIVANTGVSHSLLMGDTAETARISGLLAASGKRKLAGNEQEADELLFCEGEGFSFRETIRHLETYGNNGGRWRMLIHGKDCGAAIGSPDRNDQGVVVIL